MVDGWINGSLEIKKITNPKGLKSPSNCYLDKNIVENDKSRSQKLNQLRKTK